MNEEFEIDLGELTIKQTLFLYEYLKDFDVRRAGLAAGFDAINVLVAGNRLIRSVKMKPIINAAKHERARQTKINANWVLEQLKMQYEFNIDDFLVIDDVGIPRYDFSNATTEQLACVEAFEISPSKFGDKIKVKGPSKLKILELIGKHTDVEAYKEKLEIEASVSFTFDHEDSKA